MNVFRVAFMLSLLGSAQAETTRNSLPSVSTVLPSKTLTKPLMPAQAPVPPVETNFLRSDSPVDAMLNEDLIRSLRDPFQLPAILLSKKDLPKTDLEVFPLKDFKLNGVVTGPKKTRAMITTPSNKVFFVRVGDRIGVRDGKISQISSDSIKVIEFYADEHGKRVPDVYQLTLSGELLSLSKKEEE